MAVKDMTIAEQLKRAAEALDQIDSTNVAVQEVTPVKKADLSSWKGQNQSSRAPVGSLSAELLRTDGLLRYGRG